MSDISELFSMSFVRKLPDWVDVRVGFNEGIPVVAFWSEQHQLHVDFNLASLDTHACKIALANLGSAIFEKEHPDALLPLIRREAMAAFAGQMPSAADVMLRQRYRQLTEVPL